METFARNMTKYVVYTKDGRKLVSSNQPPLDANVVFPQSSLNTLPKIFASDPVCKILDAAPGDILETIGRDGLPSYRLVKPRTHSTSSKALKMQPPPLKPHHVVDAYNNMLKYLSLRRGKDISDDPEVEKWMLDDKTIWERFNHGTLLIENVSTLRHASTSVLFWNNLSKFLKNDERQLAHHLDNDGHLIVVHDVNANITVLKDKPAAMDFYPMQSMLSINVLDHVYQPKSFRVLNFCKAEDRKRFCATVLPLLAVPIEAATNSDGPLICLAQ